MQTLLNFIVKYNHWFLFIILEGISFMLLVRFNNHQGAAFFTAANGMAGDVSSMFMDINTYFGLKSANEELLKQNLEQEKEIISLRMQLARHSNKEALNNDPTFNSSNNEYIFNTANVVNNSFNALNNYIVLDKGTDDGVLPEMGVYNNYGVVGVVYLASERYSLVIPLLNSKSRISCRVGAGNSSCTLQWDGCDIRFSHLIDLPRYAKFEPGDTVRTSGFSSIFPAEIPVGTIENIEDSDDGMFYQAKVRLFNDFASIGSVFVVGNKGHNEQEELEKMIPRK